MTRVVLLALSLLCGAIAACGQAAAQTDSARECLRFSAHVWDISNEAAFRRDLQKWNAVCRQALAEDAGNPRIKVSLARALQSDGKRAEAVPLLRAAAEQNDAEAFYELYETHKSYDRSDVTKSQLVNRAEAERGLRRAAELGHPHSMWLLAVLLDRGSTVKRDPAGAILWAERAMARPSKDATAADIEIRLGHFLAKSDKAEHRARGIRILENYPGRGDAKAYLARALRSSDPQRARKLLEEAERTFPGHAIPLLADMLVRGEGGAKDERRGLSLLQGRRAPDVSAVKAALGRLHLEGRFVRRDVAEAVKLIRLDAIWSHDSRLEVMGLLADNPEVRIVNPGGFLFDATEAAELDEPGAALALIDLKLSQSAQFADRAGGCALAQRAIQQGLNGASERAKACRN